MSNRPLCIPGFLGSVGDFDWLQTPHTTVDLFSKELYAESLTDCGIAVARHCREAAITSIIGYSLGGRLALHALCKAPTLFGKAVIISAHTGLSSENEKKLRAASDMAWAEKFKESAWDTVVTEWDAQPVLHGTPSHRDETRYKRELLAHALSQWSLGRQGDLLTELKSVTTKILWITGENDEKFTSIAQRASRSVPNGVHVIVPNAGHRVMRDNPSELGRIVTSFLG